MDGATEHGWAGQQSMGVQGSKGGRDHTELETKLAALKLQQLVNSFCFRAMVGKRRLPYHKNCVHG